MAVVNVALVLRSLTPGGPPDVVADAPADDVGRARVAAREFLDRYVGVDGRVARVDQGGDTVSEGQAYAMLLAVVSGDRERFERSWSWAVTNLRGRDGLLAWRWSNGRVVDEQPASDADLDAAYALLLASRTFGDADYQSAASELGDSILREHVTEVGGPRILAAGPWARRDRVVVNPSYFFPSAFDALAVASGDERWTEVERSSYRVLAELMREPPGLPPEWAVVEPSGTVRAVGGPEPDSAAPAAFGFGAARTPVRLAAACSEPARTLAGSMRPFFAEAGELDSAYDMRGRPVELGRHPMMAVAASASARAAGDVWQAREWLDRAEDLDRRRPTYYGSAWIALGRAFAEGLLGCRTPMDTRATGGDR